MFINAELDEWAPHYFQMSVFFTEKWNKMFHLDLIADDVGLSGSFWNLGVHQVTQ
jgi:hypothetical protein